MATRALEITLEPNAGQLNLILAWLNGKLVIDEPGTKGTWKGNVDGEVRLETVVRGQGPARYALTIDLDGTANDQRLVLSLTEGYHDAEYRI